MPYRIKTAILLIVSALFLSLPSLEFVSAITLPTKTAKKASLLTTPMDPSTIRGVNIYITASEQDISQAQKSGANTLRLMLLDGDLLPRSQTFKPSDIDRYYKLNLKRIKTIIELGRKYNMLVILNVHEFPGRVRWSGYIDYRLWLNTSDGTYFRDLYDQTWVRLTTDLKSYPANLVWFELFNEPEPFYEVGLDNQPNTDFFIWDKMQDRCLADIRATESKLGLTARTLVATPPYELSPEYLQSWGWQPSQALLGDSHIVLTMHFYEPKEFTFQNPATRTYNGTVDDIRTKLTPVANYQSSYPNLPIIITEFGTVKAPGSDLWISQVSQALNELKVGATYHSMGGAKYFRVPSKESLYDINFTDKSDQRVSALKTYFYKK